MKKLLDIKPEERKKVTNLFFQNFFDGLGTSFFYAMSIFIFLGNGSHHDALHYYPLVFLIGGLLILMVSPVYSKIETRARTDYLIYGLGIFVIILVLISYTLLKTDVTVYTGIVLLILYQLIYYLRQTQFWGLSSLSFNVLQSKRLFSIVSAGDLPAKFLGYAVVFKLLEKGIIQPESLIYFAVLAYLISFYFLRRVFISDHHLKHSSHQHFRSGVKEIKFFGNHLIKTMAIMAFFIMFVVFVVDYSFTKVIMHKINDEDADMYFLVSTILYSSYGLASILKLFFTGKVFQNLGLRWTMVMTPVFMLLLIISTLLINISSTDSNWYYVRLFIFLYIGFIVFRDVIGKPIFLTLFQPLSKKMRLHGHNIVKGIAEPLGMVISGGLLLIYYGYFEEYRLDLFAIALIIPILLWMFSAANVRGAYNKMLQNVINLRLLSGNQFLLFDTNTNEKLIEKLDSEDEIEVLFALDHLKNYDLSIDKLIPLLKRKSDLIHKAIWEVISTIVPAEEFRDLVSKHFDKDLLPHLRQHVFSLVAMNLDEPKELLSQVSEEYPDITESMLLVWVKNKKFELPEKVNSIVHNYLESSAKDKYYTGLRLQKIIPYEKGKAYITKSLESSNKEQRKSAIIGSFGFLNPQFFNRIIHFMNDPEMNRVVKNELMLLGDDGLNYYLPLLSDADDINSYRLIQVMGQIDSSRVKSELIDLLRFNNPDLRKLLLDTIYTFGPKNLKPYKNEILTEYHKEIVQGARILSVYDKRKTEYSYLNEELKDLIQRIIRILSMLFDSKIIQRIEDGIFSDNSDFQANSIETLNQILRPELFKPLKPVIEGFIDPPAIQHKTENISKLLANHTLLNKWTTACILAQHGCNDAEIINSLKERKSSIINEQLNLSKMETNDTLRIMEKVIILKQTNLFSTTPENILVEVAWFLKEERFEPGSVIFNKGDKGDCMYIIYSGKVKIHDGKSVLAVFDQREFFGDLAMLDTEPRSATATAETESVLLRLEQEAIYELMDNRIEVAQGIIKTLCERIRTLNSKFVETEKL